jgi:hypothetical protein
MSKLNITFASHRQFGTYGLAKKWYSFIFFSTVYAIYESKCFSFAKLFSVFVNFAFDHLSKSTRGHTFH